MRTIKILFLALITLATSYNVNAQEVKKENTKLLNFKPTIKINGRVQYDFEFIKVDDGEDDWLNGSEFRRVYLSAKGKLGKDLSYKVEFDFAKSKIGYRDVYIKYNAGKYGSLAIGSMTEPTSLNMSTSSKYITFMERSMLTSLQNFRWGSGLHYANYGLFDGKATLQMAYTNNGKSSGAFKDLKLEDGMNFTSRITTNFLRDDASHRIVHLGVNYDNRPSENITNGIFRPETHMGLPVSLGFEESEGRSDLGFELATTFGPLSIQGEYKTQKNELPAEHYRVKSYYAFASYFITGEHRPYKKGTFGRVKPKKSINNGGFGAFELAFRYSNVDNKDYNPINHINEVSNYTVGVNWYLTSHARVMYNYVGSDLKGNDRDKQVAHMFRVAVDF